MKNFCRTCHIFCNQQNPIRTWGKWVVVVTCYLVSLIASNIGFALMFADDSNVCKETVWFESCYWDAFPLTFLFLTPLYAFVSTFIIAFSNSKELWKKSRAEAQGLYQLINE